MVSFLRQCATRGKRPLRNGQMKKRVESLGLWFFYRKKGEGRVYGKWAVLIGVLTKIKKL